MNSLNRVWCNYRYKIKDQIVINNNLISESINTFWNSDVKDVNSNQHIIILFRIKTCDGVILTLGHLQKLSTDDKDYFIEYVQDILSMKSEDYNEFMIDEIIFSYGVREGEIISKGRYLPNSSKAVQYQLYKHYKLPVTMEPLKYGKLTYYDKATNTYIIQITPLTHAHITPGVDDGVNENKVQIFKNGSMILEYTDRMIDDNTFMRLLGKNVYQYNLEGELELFKVSKPTKFIKPIKTKSVVGVRLGKPSLLLGQVCKPIGTMIVLNNLKLDPAKSAANLLTHKFIHTSPILGADNSNVNNLLNNKTTIAQAQATTVENNELLSLTKGSSLQKNISSEGLYTEEVSGVTSPILRFLIKKGFKDEGIKIIKPIEFKPLSKEDAKTKLEELSQFKSEINELKKVDVRTEDGIIKIINKDQSAVIEINEVETLAKVQNYIDIFKDINIKYDAKWEDFKRKLDLQVSLGKEVDSDSLDISDMCSINETFIKNKDEIVDTYQKAKPLGELGEISLNELIVKGSEVLSPLGNINNISTGVTSAFTGISLFFMYKGVVSLFDSLAFKDYPKNISPENLLDYKKMRTRELKTFMILGAPLIVGSLYAIKQVSFPTQVNVELESKGTSSVITSSQGAEKINDESLIRGIGLISLIKNKLPNWLKYILLITISFISLYYISKFEGLISEGGGFKGINSILLNNIIFIKLFLVLGSISSFIMSFYYILNIFLFIKFSNKNPIAAEVQDRLNYLPQFIKDWVKFIEKMSKYEDKGYYIEFYLRLIIVYLLIFLMCVGSAYNID